MITVHLKTHPFEIILARRNITIGEFADKLGISRVALHYAMKGRNGISAPLRRAIMNELKVKSFDKLFEIEGE